MSDSSSDVRQTGETAGRSNENEAVCPLSARERHGAHRSYLDAEICQVSLQNSCVAVEFSFIHGFVSGKQTLV